MVREGAKAGPRLQVPAGRTSSPSKSALTRRDFVRELRAVSGESLIRVHSIGPYHRLLAVGDAK